MSEVQSIIFAKNTWGRQEAFNWLKRHKFKPIKRVDKTANLFRYRIKPPEQFSRFKTKQIDAGIKLVLGFK